MYRICSRKIVGWLAGAVGLLALVLSSVGTAAADEDPTLPNPTINTQNNPQERDLVKQENAMANERRAAPR